jgi:ABC-type glycerol-3-phosphate transport system permease component
MKTSATYSMKTGKSILKSRAASVLKHVFLLLWCSTTFYPIIWVLLNAFRDNTQIYGKPFALPNPLIPGNYPRAFKGIHLEITLVNSLFYSAVTVVLVIMLSAMSAFYITKMARKNTWLYTYFIIGIMIPVQAIIIPIFITMRQFSLINTRTGLILIYVVTSLSFGIFILCGFMRKGLPDEILEAAVIDGCGPVDTFFRVALPISQTGIVTVATFIFLSIWNEFLFALLMLANPLLRTLNLSVYMLRGQYSSDQGLMSAGITILIAPAIIIYILFQEQVVKGLTAGAIKG